MKQRQTKTQRAMAKGPRGQTVSYVTKAGVVKPLGGSTPIETGKTQGPRTRRKTGHEKKRV
jgi:hypothetical protein